MGRNHGSLGGNSRENTDKHSRNKSVIWQSREGTNSNEGVIKSPHVRGNRVKQPLQYRRSISNDGKTISSIVRSTKRNFPPIGFGSRAPSEPFNNSNTSKRVGSNQNILKSNDQSSVMSPIPFDKKYYGKGFQKEENLYQDTGKYSGSYSNKEVAGFGTEIMGSHTLDHREPLIVSLVHHL